MRPVYVTGNQYKKDIFNKMVGIELEHEKVDVEEIQSLDLLEVVENKAKEAYRVLKRPIIVEDTQLIFNTMGKLPGPLIKWFLEELKPEGLCKILGNYNDRTAIAGSAIAYYDGKNLKIFTSNLNGSIALEPKGDSGFGWNVIFIPIGTDLTFGEMDSVTFEMYYKKVKPFDQIREYLLGLDQ